MSEFKYENDPSIIAASRIIVSEGCQPYRIVLRRGGDKEYTTHQENLQLEGKTWKHGDFYWGHYFSAMGTVSQTKEEAFRKANEDFLERCGKM